MQGSRPAWARLTRSALKNKIMTKVAQVIEHLPSWERIWAQSLAMQKEVDLNRLIHR
jgi:hypothetical protein